MGTDCGGTRWKKRSCEYGRSPCKVDPSPRIREISKAILAASSASPLFKVVAAPIIDGLAPELEKELKKQPGWVAEQLAPNPAAYCAPLMALLPRGSTATNVKYMAGDGHRGVGLCWQDGNGMMICGKDPHNPARQPFQGVDFCSWIERKQSAPVVSAVFKNWSHDMERWASMTVTFTVPAGVTPVYKLYSKR